MVRQTEDPHASQGRAPKTMATSAASDQRVDLSTASNGSSRDQAAELQAAAPAIEEAERKKRAEEEDRARQEFQAELQAQKDAVAQVHELKAADESRRRMRESNSPSAVAASREAHENNRSLKSDLKRISTFTKKIRAVSEDSREAILKDLDALNLHHFVSEIVNAVLEAKIRTASDVFAAIQVCSALHQRYSEFTDGLLQGLQNVLLPTSPSTEEDKDAPRKKRQALRLLIELFLVGVYSNVQLFVRVFNSIVPPHEGSKPAQQALRFRRGTAQSLDMNLFVTFVRYGGEDLLGVMPRRVRMAYDKASRAGLAELRYDQSKLVDEDVREMLRERAQAAYESMCVQLVSAHQQRITAERRAEKDRLLHGSLTDEKEKALEDRRKAYEKLVAGMQALSEALDMVLPELPEDDKDDEGTGQLGLSVWDGAMGQSGANAGPYGDETTRAFYEDLPDLLAMLPSALLGLTEEEAERLRNENSEAKKKEEMEAQDAEMDAMEQELEGKVDVTKQEEGEGAVAISAGDEEGPQEEQAPTGSEPAEDTMEMDDDDDAPGRLKVSDVTDAEAAMPAHKQLALLLDEALPLCFNADRADDFCLRFCHLNSKSARKRLVAALYDVPRQALDLLPMYARIVATLDKVMKDIAPALIAELQSEFRYFQRKKPTSHLEAKLKNVKYIGELVKFKVAPPIVPFTCLKICVDNFTPHNVEVTCALLETCGLYLFRTAHTHARLNHYLDIMMRLKKVRHFDPTYETLIENAYFMCNPPERVAQKVDELTPLQQYIRHLYFEELSESQVEFVLKQTRKLPWNDPQLAVEPFYIMCIVKTARGRFDHIHLVCDVLAGLVKVRETTIVKLADRVMEDLVRGLEGAGERDPQGHLALAKLLGEMYNYAILPAGVVFDALYMFINHGHEVPEHYKMPQPNPDGRHLPPLPPLVPVYVTHDPRVQTPWDPPGDTFRSQLVCKLLQTTGAYFVGGKLKNKLDRFVTYFQRYLFCRGYVPPGTEMEVLDTLDELEEKVRQYLGESSAGKAAAAENGQAQPLIPRFTSFEEVQAVIEKMEAEEHGALESRMLDRSGARGEDSGMEVDEEEEEEDEEDDDEGREGHRRGRGEGGEEQGEGEGGEEGEDAVGLEEDDDDAVAVRRDAYVKTEEDLELEREFEKAFAATLMNAVDERKSTARTGLAADNMVLPTTLPKVLKKEADGEDGEDSEMGTSLAGTRGVKFCMLKRGNKGRLEARELVVPAYTALAAQIKSHQDAQREEHNVLKQKVLQYQELLAASGEEEAMPLPKVYNAPLSEDDLSRANKRIEGQHQHPTTYHPRGPGVFKGHGPHGEHGGGGRGAHPHGGGGGRGRR